jgi:RNA polymerase sigma factor (TIGR02999 family)
MDEPSNRHVTELLQAWSEGNETALSELTPIVYRELHKLARRYMAEERPGHTLGATALVHEAYVRLVDVKRMRWQNRSHFFAVSAQMMRRILVEFARRRRRRKRGDNPQRVDLEDVVLVSPEATPDVVALDEALTELARLDARKAQVVELRFFGGMGVEETAEILKISPETVMREWNRAKAWLYAEMNRG